VPDPSLQIRLATAADAEAVAAMAAEFAQYLAALDDGPPGQAYTPLDAERFVADGFGEAPLFACLIAERDGAPAGYLLYHFGYSAEDALPTLHVADLFVRDAARRHGVGSALMAAAADVLRRRGGMTVVWTVWDRNEAAMAFYEALGGKVVLAERLMFWSQRRWPAP
jgi:GNAT superfamily N-acetyltransferase